MATNNLIFKGIQQVKALPTNPEKGVIYFVREHNGDKLTGNAKVYFGSRLYGEVNETKLAELQAAITANADAIEVINGKLGKWTEDLGTVANAVVANKNSINNLTTATTKNIANAKTEAISAATDYTNTQIDSVNKTLTAYTATTNTTLTGLRTDINTVSGATTTNTSAIAKLNGDAETAGSVAKAVADAKSELVNGASDGYNTLGGLETEIKAVAQSVLDKNVSAEGDGTYITASADKNKVTVTATKKTTDAIALAETALQKNDIATGTANGTIKVDGTDVAVKGLGSAAYTNSSAYDASGAAATVKTELLGTTKDGDATTIAALNTKIENVEDAAKTYEIKKITTGLSANVKEAYGLFDEDGVQTGETINIYKDSSLKEVKLSGQTLQFTYILTNGSESTVGVDVSAFLSESEFGNGLQVVDHKVSVKKDTSSEAFLSVSADGIKLSGVQQAINNAVENKNVEATGDTYVSATASGNKVTVTASETTKASLALADSALQKNDIATGTANGTISVDNEDVAVKGLKSAAYTEASAYATAAQGTKADNAATKTDFNAHSGNTVMHITTAERSAWNAKLDTTTHTAYTAATKTTLDSIENRLTSITNDAVTSVAAADGETAITVAGEQEVTVTLNVSASEGNMIVKNADGIFAALYYGGDDVEE